MTSGRKKVLVVEDDPSIRKLVLKHLSSLDVDVAEAADGKSALGQLAGQVPDLVCLDLMLPELHGFDVWDQMRQHPAYVKVPILVISARKSLQDRAYAQEVGLTQYLMKPFTRAEFLKVARGLLEGGG